ncbi:MAG: cytochrome c biogenesis protein CcdA [Patescibacteria group bacterium]
MLEFPVIAAFVGGLVSFLSPCIVPIVPGFLAYLAGTTLADAPQRRRDMLVNAVWFVVGFSLVFAVLGVLLNTILATVAYDARIWMSRIGGGVIVLFGLMLMDVIRIPWFTQTHAMQVHPDTSARWLTSFLFGAAFAAGWTPCVGAVLGAILTLSIAQPGTAFVLLMAYALGLGIPFLLAALFASAFQKGIMRWGGVLPYISKVFGVLLVVMGVLVMMQRLERIASFDILLQFLRP